MSEAELPSASAPGMAVGAVALAVGVELGGEAPPRAASSSAAPGDSRFTWLGLGDVDGET